MPKSWTVSRLTFAQRRGRDLRLPVLDAGQYLVEAMQILGPLRPGLAEARATDWPEIAAFAGATERLSEPWEIETLAAMCAGYCAALKAGEDPLAIAPVDLDDSTAG